MLFAPKGNLVVNGDFEEGTPGTPPEGWISDNVSLVGPGTAFTGHQAASVGGIDPAQVAVLRQDVTVAPFRRYQLSFRTAALQGPGPGGLTATVRWLDHSCTDMGPGLSVYIPGHAAGSLPQGLWNAQVHLTDRAPLGTCMARIAFAKSATPGAVPVILDRVSFADVT